MKVAILDNDGRLMLFRNPERITETWWDGKCLIEAQMKADNSGIVFESFRSASAKLLTEYFEVGEVPGRTITESEYSATVSEVLPRIGGRPVADQVRELLAQFGLTIVDDPEPTNAESLAELIREIGYDIRHNGRLSGSNALALDLDARGVKAPGGDES